MLKKLRALWWLKDQDVRGGGGVVFQLPSMGGARIFSGTGLDLTCDCLLLCGMLWVCGFRDVRIVSVVHSTCKPTWICLYIFVGL